MAVRITMWKLNISLPLMLGIAACLPTLFAVWLTQTQLPRAVDTSGQQTTPPVFSQELIWQTTTMDALVDQFNRLECTLCGDNFFTGKDVLDHLKKEHATFVESGKPFLRARCPKCGMPTPCFAIYLKHLEKCCGYQPEQDINGNLLVQPAEENNQTFDAGAIEQPDQRTGLKRPWTDGDREMPLDTQGWENKADYPGRQSGYGGLGMEEKRAHQRFQESLFGMKPGDGGLGPHFPEFLYGMEQNDGAAGFRKKGKSFGLSRDMRSL